MVSQSVVLFFILSDILYVHDTIMLMTQQFCLLCSLVPSNLSTVTIIQTTVSCSCSSSSTVAQIHTLNVIVL